MSSLPLSPLAPKQFPQLKNVAGVELGAVAAGLRYKGRPDLLLVRLKEGTAAAGVFTKTKMPAAPVDWSKEALRDTKGAARLLVVNAGNANAFTGEKGVNATRKTAEIAAEIEGCAPEEVMIASTGVIGETLDVSPFKKFLTRIHGGLSASLWKDAANAIMTTDTFPKACSRITEIEGKPITITGIAKGSGMIAPDMATMLGFIFTDAPIKASCLQAILTETTDKSFNSITVDGDTSTNDTVLAFATGGGAEGAIASPDDPRLDNFKKMFAEVMIDLAQQIVRDGEGATKFITITVEGAENQLAAHRIAMSVANSPLVKTAVAGEDPNWGRLVMAVGKAGEKADRDQLAIWIGEQQVAKNGMVLPSYEESEAASHMQGELINFKVNVGIGEASATVWTCDLTSGYIAINADYRS
ncbi:bifunctional glutamate N-acetyltransferase/amino-acid acetyltransferase ArgJ [Kordiimonas sp. SCSIO 12603]|uniref:bifunctional glutamate N-acetyltransferase/amino-acid acetyltransferase ArgJ n=1 Tax=Kordiimonas sp. SCSIO 12603 TaxID=2829596 RepID=UPI002101FCDF|nr:bifunctional glutamate N-acetyltransferase/amino-acid acetyltransferase ArgJ [Kordiimonas sp. SCSIO 12603]UTW59481.1 bifunctional glutamate N-acetyltransferase/amino-acid acetyltransferase ArgJ [Kordiimonas sp. SCSIO 12603]